MNIALRSVEELLNATELVNAHLEVQDRIREAAIVLWRQPREAEKRYLSSADRCCWPTYVRDWHAYGYEKARMPKIPPQPREIDRMEETLEWIAWLATQDEVAAKMVWRKYALGWRMSVIAHRERYENRKTVYRKCKHGIHAIVARFLTNVPNVPMEGSKSA